MGKLIRSVSGNVVNFKSAAQVPFESLVVNFEPVQSGSGDPSPSNVRPINGWTGISVQKCRKNLFDYNSIIKRDGYLLNDNGVEQTTSISGYLQSLYKVDAGEIYTISGTIASNSNAFRIYYYNENKEFINRSSPQSQSSVPYTFTIPDNCVYITIQYPIANIQFNTIQIEKGSIATAYEPYTSTTYPISWQSEAGTVYGGYVDLVSGVLIKTYEYVTLKDLSWTKRSSTGNQGQYIYYGIVSSKYLTQNVDASQQYCDIYPVKYINSGQNAAVGYLSFYRYGNSTPSDTWVYFAFDDISTLEGFESWLNDNNPHLCYRLNTNVTYQLTPQQLKTLRGTNNIWSDANGTIEAEFEHMETGEIGERKRKILLQPKQIEVTWNQKAYDLSADWYQRYNTSKTAVSYDDGVVTQTWLSRGGSYTYTITPKSDYRFEQISGNKYYISYMLMPDFSEGLFSVDWVYNVIPKAQLMSANEWGRFSAISTAARDGKQNMCLINLRNYSSTNVQENSTCKAKAPIVVDLTLMYGAGNEPTLEEFEYQCKLNGINLTQYQALNISGTQRWWII